MTVTSIIIAEVVATTTAFIPMVPRSENSKAGDFPMADLKWFELDNRGLAGVTRSLRLGRAFTKVVGEHVDVNEGQVLSLASRDATEEELYSLDFGDLSIGRRSALKGIAHEFSAYADGRSDQPLLLVEDSVALPGEKWVVNVGVEHVVVDDTPCYFTRDLSAQRVEDAVEAGTSACLANAYLTKWSDSLVPNGSVDEATVISLVKNVHVLLVESYDGTGYLLWKSRTSDFEPSLYPL
jgi:hypothetical protein